MKKLIIAAVAASVLAGPVLAAPYGGHGDRRYEQPDRRDDGRHRETYRTVEVRREVVRRDVRADQRHDDHRWRRGDRFEGRYARDYRVIEHPRRYRLHDAPRGYRWVRSGDDAVLVGLTSGIVAAVVPDIMR